MKKFIIVEKKSKIKVYGQLSKTFFLWEDLVKDIEFSLSGNKKTFNKRFTSLSPSRKVLLLFYNEFQLKNISAKRGQKLTPLGETLPKKHH